MDITRQPDETAFQHKLRLCLAKRNKELDMGWVEIRDYLGLDIHPDLLRHQAAAYFEYDNYLKGCDTAATTILSISDLHTPYQLPVEKLEEWVGKVDILQINGDIFDCQSISKFSKQFRISLIEEMIEGRNYLINLFNYLRPKKVVINYGNHDIRLGDFLARKLDNEVQELTPQTAIDYIFEDGFTHYDRMTGAKTKYDPLVDIFPNINIEYTGTWYSQIGDAIFVHPKAYSIGPLKTAEKALYFFRNEGFNFRNLIMAHTHRIGQYKIGNSQIYEQGAFCRTDQMKYADGLMVNSQKQGYIVLFQDKDGNTIESKTRLVSLN